MRRSLGFGPAAPAAGPAESFIPTLSPLASIVQR